MARAPRMTETDETLETLTPDATTGTASETLNLAPAESTTPRSFDAFAHLRKIRTRQGMQDYLDVKWRVAWVRADHPTAHIVTEQVEGDEQHARFKCTITLPNGAIATGHGSETAGDFPDFYEKAETKSIGRACASLGYGTDSASDFDDGEPLDGRPAAKDERADRNRREANAPAPTEPERAEGVDNVTNVTQIAPRRTQGTDTVPSRLPATRRMPAAPTSNGGNGTGTHGPALTSAPAPTPAMDDRSNIHQHTQLRALADNGFDLNARLATIGVSDLESLNREQAKELILAGRAATSGAHALH